MHHVWSLPDSVARPRVTFASMEEDDDRTVELSSVEAIFPELVRHGSYSVSLEIPVPLSKSVRVVFPATQQVAPAPASLHDTLSFQQPVNDAAAEPEIIHLFNLPPLNATIKLPEGYPSEKPPHVQLTPQEAWLPQAKLDELRDASVQLWEDMGRDMVVYSYIEHMQEAAENCFDLAIDGTLDIPPQLKVALLDFDCKVKKEKFDKETFECGICLEPKKGLACYRLLNCGHVFCVACLQDFYNSCITEGDVDGVKCMDPSCGKEPPQTRDGAKRTRKPKKLQPSELLQIPISEEQVQRYVKIRRKRKLERNPNTIYCPRKWCQGPARAGNATSSDGESSDSDDENENPGGPEPEHIVAAAEEPDSVEETEDGEDEEPVPQRAVPGERLAVCTDCGFAFCMVCAKTWHGEFGRCSTRLAEELSKEEKASAEYMRKHSTPCPTCNVRSQKSLGCNHMKCRQCNTHFCYLCASWLNKDNPYEHFNTEGTPCYQLLWELEEGDGEHVFPALSSLLHRTNAHSRRWCSRTSRAGGH